MALVGLGGDGRDQTSPLWVIPLGPDGLPTSKTDPILSSVTDPTTGQSANVLSVGANQFAMLVRDNDNRKLLENILVQLTILNRQIGTMASEAGTTSDGSPDESGI